MNWRVVVPILIGLAALAGYVGYRRIPPRPVDKQLDVMRVDNKLVVKFDPLGECGTGEVEAILAAAPRKDPLLLTVEPLLLGDDGFDPVSERLEALLLKQKNQRVLQVPDRKRGTHAGIFICSDRKRTGRCADKKTVGFDELQSSAFILQDSKKFEDQIFYFQYVFASRNGMQFLKPSADEAGARAAIRAALTANKTPEKVAVDIEQRVMDWLVKVGSTTLVPNREEANPTVTIQLSQMDETLCPIRPKLIEKVPPGAFRSVSEGAHSSRKPVAPAGKNPPPKKRP